MRDATRRDAPHLHVDERVVLVDVLEVLQVVVEEEDELVHSLGPLLGPAFAFQVALEVESEVFRRHFPLSLALLAQHHLLS